MAIDYNAIDYGNGSDGYGYGSFGLGQGFNGSLYGGDPTATSYTPPQMGGTRSPVMQIGGGGNLSGTPIQRRAPRAPGAAEQQSVKPFLSQLFGFNPQGMGERMHPGGPGRQGPPQVTHPITRFQPLPQPRPGNPPPRMYPGGPGGPPRMYPGGPGGPPQRMYPGGPGPQPIASGGAMAGGQGRRPIATAGPRRMQPGL